MYSPEKHPYKEIKNPLWDFAAIGALATGAFFGFLSLKDIFRRH